MAPLVKNARHTLLLLLTLVLASTAQAGEEPDSLTGFFETQFKAFPAAQVALKTQAPLQWNRRARRYRTRISQAWAEAKEPNFAGHFLAVENIGCGTGCLVIFVIDWNTGEIFSPPENHVFAVRKDSRLMILKPYDICSAYGPPILLEFTGKLFREVKHSQCHVMGSKRVPPVQERNG
ncbi:hypothetical protein POL68_35235 [Stigmatella sp. ncwal1]|uniref:Uncharacterized protein n=1 Tax=Stigmatella ashevillensis TaxID=2995309 RepID=A0ABT5DJF2_9BACT|nr:hypothetical protein [Stigmatella ashevillena]MDC0713774.1 hypothetical protein [Stigmatella ashevillena]